MAVQDTAPQLSAYDWKPQIKESFEEWVERLAAPEEENSHDTAQIRQG